MILHMNKQQAYQAQKKKYLKNCQYSRKFYHSIYIQDLQSFNRTYLFFEKVMEQDCSVKTFIKGVSIE